MENQILNKLKEGMYIRTDDGYIAIYLGMDKNRWSSRPHYSFDRTVRDITDEICDEDNFMWENELKLIVAIEENLIDVIRPGDYVNGRLVYQVGYNFYDDYVVKIKEYDGIESFIFPKDIKNVVTKERFEKEAFDINYVYRREWIYNG